MKLFEKQGISTVFNHYRHHFLLKRFTVILGVDVLMKISAFILLPFYLRLMSQEEYGLYNYLLSIIQTFSLVLNFGLYIAQTKLYHSVVSAEDRGQLLFTIATTLIFFLVVIIVPVAVAGLDFEIVEFLFGKHLVYSDYRQIIFLALLVSIFNFMLTNFLYTSEKIKQAKTYNIFRIIVVNVASLLALYFFRGEAVKMRLLYTYITEFILFCFFAYYFIKELVPRFNEKLMRTSIRMGLPIMISALFGILVNFSDKFLLQKYGSLKELSNYYLAFSFSGIIGLIFSSLQSVWLPIFMKEKNVQNNFDKTRKLISILILLFSPFAIAIWFGFQVLIWTTVIPDQYSGVSGILPILLVAQLFAAFAPLFSNYLIYFEKTSLISLSGFLVSCTSIGLGMLVIPVWGVYGAALSYLASNILYFILYYCFSQRMIRQYMAGAQAKYSDVIVKS